MRDALERLAHGGERGLDLGRDRRVRRPATATSSGTRRRAHAAVDRANYTDASLATLDEAVAIGEVVLAGSRATASDVKEATKLVEKAVKKLKPVK